MRALSSHRRALVISEVQALACDEDDREEMRRVREQLAELLQPDRDARQRVSHSSMSGRDATTPPADS